MDAPRPRKWEKWSQVVAELGLNLAKPVNHVTAEQLKRTSHEEPRLMAKMDTTSDLPKIFRDNGVFLLPVSRREYVIVHGNGFHSLESLDSKPTIHETSYPVPTMAGSQIDNEGIALDYAYSSKLLEHAAGTSNVFPAFRGRRGTPRFTFGVGTSTITVDGAQIEVDGGYENLDQVLTVESKIGVPNSFNIRQLYYPFRTFEGRKQVRTFFMCYDQRSKVYVYWEYSFDPANRFEAIKLVSARSYEVRVTDAIKPKDYQNITPTMKIPPQADSVDKIMEFPFRVMEGYDTAEKMAKAFGFHKRQSSYYRAASEELGLVDREGDRYRMTAKGEGFVGLPTEKRTNAMCRLLLEYPIMHEIYMRISTNPGHIASRLEIEGLLRKGSNLTGATLPRRAQTIVAWFRWIRNNLGLVEVDNDGNIRISRTFSIRQ